MALAPARWQTSRATSPVTGVFRWLLHQPQRALDALIGQQREERRLLQLHGHGLPQRVVEHRVAGRVREVCDEHGVARGERGRRRGRQEEVPADGGEESPRRASISHGRVRSRSGRRRHAAAVSRRVVDGVARGTVAAGTPRRDAARVAPDARSSASMSAAV